MPTARSKAIAFAAVLILISGAFVASAAASTTSALAPFRSGDPYALERPLTRHGVTLGVVVGAAQEGEIVRAGGALLTLTRLKTDSEGASISKTTNPAGHAVFYVPRGVYRLDIDWGNYSANISHALARHERIAAVFDETGNIHTQRTQHRDLESRGETRALVARVTSHEANGTTPLEGAMVRVWQVVDGERSAPVSEKRTGPRGYTAFQLHTGLYEVEVEWEGETASTRVPLRTDRYASFVLDEEGLHVEETTRSSADRR